MTHRVRKTIQTTVVAVQKAKPKPFPRWVGGLAAALTAVTAIERSVLIDALGGGKLGNQLSAILVVVGVVVTVLSHSITGDGR